MDDQRQQAMGETLVALQSFREIGQPHQLLSALRWLQILIAFHVKHPPADATPP
jgi:DnaJ-domain-containing protein 1